MALIAMAVFCTEENQKHKYLEKCFASLAKTVNFKKHRLFIIDNNSDHDGKSIISHYSNMFSICDYPFEWIKNEENIGTAKAINLAWKQRKPGEHCIKIDDDMVINTPGWVELMEEAIAREPKIGQIGVKRKDLIEHPDHTNPEFRSILFNLPHKPGEKWIIAEQAKHIIGSCVMHSSVLLDRIGYLYQPGLYGFDDVLMSWRANLSGFMCCFLPQIDVDHIDPGGNPFNDWKHKQASEQMKQVSDLVDKFISHEQSLYYPCE